jgi:hypothetical protein
MFSENEFKEEHSGDFPIFFAFPISWQRDLTQEKKPEKQNAISFPRDTTKKKKKERIPISFTRDTTKKTIPISWPRIIT